MGILKNIFKRKQQPQNAFGDTFTPDLFLPQEAKSGKIVTSSSSLQVMAVFACLRVLAEGVAQVPLKLFLERQNGEGSDPARDHSLFQVLYRKPNPWQTSFEFRETMIFHVALTGNFFAWKGMKPNGRVFELIPFIPGEVTIETLNRGRMRYTITSAIDGSVQTFPQELIWHVRGPSWNTTTGLEAVRLAREAIGLSMASEESHALLHANGGQPGGLYSVEGQLGTDQYEKLRSWIEKQITRGNRFKPFVLDRGAKWTPTTMNGVDSEHINTRKHQIEEICRAFRVMPIMIGQSDKAATYASAEQMFLAHVVHTLSPWYERIEQSIACNLLSQSDNQLGYYAKFIPNALMRGAAKDRSEFYYKMWSMGALSPNDIRALEDTNPYEGGENYYTPANFAPVGETTTEGNDEPVVQTEN